MCWSLGDFSSMVRNINDLLKHYFILVKEEQIFVFLGGKKAGFEPDDTIWRKKLWKS